METGIKKQIDDINNSVQDFMKCIDLLPQSLFLKKMDAWAPRDVTAHLIGWNRYTIKGCQQLKKAELPFYFTDPGDDFCKINAVLVKEFDAKDKKKLVAQLKASAKELKDYLSTVSPADWEADFGITFGGETITIKNSVDALVADFISHRQQIEQWLEKVTEG